MEIYTGFARVYDTFMDNIPYEKWKQFIKQKLCQYDIKEGLVLDLGCGTATLTRLLLAEGYDMIGIDSSPEMLEAAQEKTESEEGILFLCQDMREFELYGTVRAIICVCDSINYILEESEIEQVFRLVNNYLDPGGIFIFDFRTPLSYAGIGSETIAENREEMSFIWENYYYEEEEINEYELSIFIQESENLYRKYAETHYQRAYSLEKMRQLLERAGLIFLEAIKDYEQIPAGEDSQRIVLIAREQGKRKNIKNRREKNE